MSSSGSEDEVTKTRRLNKPKTQFESALSSDENIFSDDEVKETDSSCDEGGESDTSSGCSDSEPGKLKKASTETSSKSKKIQ